MGWHVGLIFKQGEGEGEGIKFLSYAIEIN